MSIPTPETNAAVRHFRRYHKHGVLPREGGTGDQDARLMHAFDILASVWFDETAHPLPTCPLMGSKG